MRRLAMWAAAIVLLAGCSDPAPTPAAPAGPADPAERFEWTGCEGVAVTLRGPSAVYAGTVPAGWEDPAVATNLLQHLLYRCERVAWGPFERGPVVVLQEWHAAFAAPESCLEERAYDGYAILQSIWFSDPDLAAYARDAHRMPARAARFSQGGAGQDWAWEADGKESRVAVHDAADALDQNVTDYTTRLFWPDGSGIGAMDLRRSYDYTAFGAVATGALQPPLLHGRAMPVPEFASALATRHEGLHASATIAHFGDTACEEPS